jgi:hypothetical protein
VVSWAESNHRCLTHYAKLLPVMAHSVNRVSISCYGTYDKQHRKAPNNSRPFASEGRNPKYANPMATLRMMPPISLPLAPGTTTRLPNNKNHTPNRETPLLDHITPKKRLHHSPHQLITPKTIPSLHRHTPHPELRNGRPLHCHHEHRNRREGECW